MPVYRAIRIHMPDRPGALSAISSALAAHQVDIVRLDVVSHDDSTVVDDLVLAAVSQDDIGRAIGGFYPEVSVRTFDEVSGDPSLESAAGLRAVASASDITSAREALLRGAIRVSRADNALLLSVTSAGGLEGLAVSGPVPPITAGEPFAGRWVIERGVAAAFPVADGWAPMPFQHTLSACWVAMVPMGDAVLLLASRRLNIPFYSGELERLAAYGEAAGAVLGALHAIPAAQRLPIVADTALPARAVTLAGRLPVS